MKLIGAVVGEYNGNKYSKLVFLEPMYKAGTYGTNAVVSKAQYNYVISEIIPLWEQYEGQEVRVYYDRFGKVSEISLAPAGGAGM